MSEKKVKIRGLLRQGWSNPQIAKYVDCTPAYVSMTRTEMGLQRKYRNRLPKEHGGAYLTSERRRIIRELWLEDDYCPTRISKEVHLPVDKVIQMLQAEGLT